MEKLSPGAVGRGAVAGCTLHSLCWLFSTEPSVLLVKKMSFSCIPIVGFLSRSTFSHDQNISTSYLVSHTLTRSRSGSGSTTWNMTQPCELIAASPCHAMSGNRKIPKPEQRAESPREIRDCGLGEADSLRSRFFSTCLCQGKGAFQGQGTQACPVRVAGEDTAVVLLGKEGSDWMQFPGERKETGGRDKREGDVSTISWRGPKQGKVWMGKHCSETSVEMWQTKVRNGREIPARQSLIPMTVTQLRSQARCHRAFHCMLGM